MSFTTTEFHEILLSGFTGVVLTDCFRRIFHVDQISKLKKGVTLRKKWNRNFLWICASNFITTKFHEILLSGFRGVSLTRKTGLTD